jgi:hypothetical protein
MATARNFMVVVKFYRPRYRSRWTTEILWFDSPQRKENFTFSKGSGPALGPIQSSVRWVPGSVMFVGLKWSTNAPKFIKNYPNYLV